MTHFMVHCTAFYVKRKLASTVALTVILLARLVSSLRYVGGGGGLELPHREEGNANIFHGAHLIGYHDMIQTAY